MRVFKVLLICADNAVLSSMAQVLMYELGAGRFKVQGAALQPALEVHPLAVVTLQANKHFSQVTNPCALSDFTEQALTQFDFIFYLAPKNNAPKLPMHVKPTAQWRFDNPAEVIGTATEQYRAFYTTYMQLRRRIQIFQNLPVQKLERLAHKPPMAEPAKVNAYAS